RQTVRDCGRRRLSHVLRFFFSSRRRHTSWPRDWSSDVCSSDLEPHTVIAPRSPSSTIVITQPPNGSLSLASRDGDDAAHIAGTRSEERRVGKECRSRGWPDHEKKNQ